MNSASSPSPTLKLWKKYSGSAIKRRLFSLGVGFKAPYFLTTNAQVQVLEPGYCKVRARNWWLVHNHIGTFHAIAMCNLAEAAMGIMAEATVPPTHRWIPLGIEAKYVARGETSLTAEAKLDPLPEFGDEKFDVEVPVLVKDEAGTVITEAKIPVRFSPKS